MNDLFYISIVILILMLTLFIVGYIGYRFGINKGYEHGYSKGRRERYSKRSRYNNVSTKIKNQSETIRVIPPSSEQPVHVNRRRQHGRKR